MLSPGFHGVGVADGAVATGVYAHVDALTSQQCASGGRGSAPGRTVGGVEHVTGQ